MVYNENVLPARVSELMQEHDMTQGQLAQLLDMPQQAVSARLLGKTRFSIADLAKMANHFQCTPGELLAADVLFTGGL